MSSLRALLRRLCTREGGFTMIEVLAAMLVMTSGIVALVGSLDKQRELVTHSERKQAAAHVAEKEMERILALSYDKVAFATGTELASSPDPNHPNYFLEDSGKKYQWDRRSPNHDPLVTADTGTIAPGPTEWTSAPTDGGRISGKIYRYVTRVDDSDCRPAGSCPNGSYRRVTVAVTLNGPGGPRLPTLVTSFAIDPNDGPETTAGGAYTECLNDAGQLVLCKGSTNPFTFYYLYDTPASTGNSRQDITGDHLTHSTAAPSLSAACNSSVSSGCPRPDLMGTAQPPDGSPSLYKYSVEALGDWAGGRVLVGDTATCSGTPSATDKYKGQLWVTPPLGAAKTLTGAGGLTLYSQNLGGVASDQLLCLAFYDVPNSISNLVTAPATEIGRASLTRASWPGAMSLVSFRLNFRGALGNVTLASGRRIGLRVWTASGNADIGLAYDHPSYESFLQLDEAN